MSTSHQHGHGAGPDAGRAAPGSDADHHHAGAHGETAAEHAHGGHGGLEHVGHGPHAEHGGHGEHGGHAGHGDHVGMLRRLFWGSLVLAVTPRLCSPMFADHLGSPVPAPPRP